MPTILEDRFFRSLAIVKNVTIPQLVLTWGMQRETVVIPKSVHKERIVENFGASNVRLNETEMRLIGLQDRKARFNNPSKSWGVDLFDDLDGA